MALTHQVAAVQLRRDCLGHEADGGRGLGSRFLAELEYVEVDDPIHNRLVIWDVWHSLTYYTSVCFHTGGWARARFSGTRVTRN